MVAAATDSPSTIRVNRPKRSAMWCGCHDVGVDCSAHTGTSSSATTITMMPGTPIPSGSSSRRPQPTMQTLMPTA